MRKQKFIIPGKPVSKNGDRVRYVQFKGREGGFISHYTDKEVTAYAKKVEKYIIAKNPFKYSGAIAVHFYVSVKPPESMPKSKQAMAEVIEFDEDEKNILMPTTKPDFDNLIKNILDAIKKHLMVDDSYVCDSSFRKRYGDSDYVMIEVEQIGMAAQWSVGEIKRFVEENMKTDG